MFRKGDKVVHPRHGAAVVEDLVELERFGEQRVYVKLRLPHGLTLMVPVESTEQIGLRGVVSRGPSNSRRCQQLWGKRYRANLAKLFSGDIYHVAEIVRDLSLRERGKGLSSAEKRMLVKAREILISELTFVVGSTEENAEAMLDEVLGESR